MACKEFENFAKYTQQRELGEGQHCPIRLVLKTDDKCYSSSTYLVVDVHVQAKEVVVFVEEDFHNTVVTQE